MLYAADNNIVKPHILRRDRDQFGPADIGRSVNRNWKYCGPVPGSEEAFTVTMHAENSTPRKLVSSR